MKKLSAIFFLTFALTVGVAYSVTPTPAHAEDPPTAEEVGATETEESGVAAKETVTRQAPADPSYIEQGLGWLVQKLLSIFSWLLGVAALTLDTAVYYTVVTMGNVVNDLSAIGVTWRILRDIGNIALLFGFIAIAFTIILDVNWYGGGYKFLPMVLIAAVTLNFSLFVTQAVVDVGNLFATQFYTQINGGNPATPAGASFSGDFTDSGIATKIMAQLGFQKLFDVGTSYPNADTVIIVGFFGIILAVVATFVFFTLAFILIFRFVALVFLMISSPIGFAGLAIPKLDSLAKQWWHQLFTQAFTAPILLLGLYIALAVITDAQFLTGFGVTNNGWAAIFETANYPGLISMVLSFVVGIGLLLTVAVLSKKIGAAGAGKAMAWGGKLSFGVTGWAARNSVGWGAYRFGQSRLGTRFARTPLVGRRVTGAFNKVGAASFDFRSTKALSSLPFGGVDAGKAGGKGGFEQKEKDYIKDQEKYAKSLKQTDTEKKAEKDAKAWKEAADKLKSNEGKEHNERMAHMAEEHKKEINGIEEKIKREEEALEKAKKTGTPTDVYDAQVALKKSQDELGLRKRKQEEEKEDAKQTHLKTLSSARAMASAAADREKQMKQAPAREFATRLSGKIYKVDQSGEYERDENGNKILEDSVKDSWYYKTVGKVPAGLRRISTRKEFAADKVIKEATKSDKDKTKEQIAKLLEDEAKKKPGGGDDVDDKGKADE